MQIKTFDEAAEYLDSFSYRDQGRPGFLRCVRLERMELLLKALGNPEKSYRTIHLAGSKGKGSTALYLAKLLETAGFKTGLYLSPHLFDYRERFTLAGSFFSDEMLIRVINDLKTIVDGLSFPSPPGAEKPSTFELYTAYAYMLFREAGCEWAVIETGLGGRLDATNTIESTASVLLPVELEHTDVLGDTIEKIAAEKSRIIKKTDTVFIARQRAEAENIFLKEAEAQGAPCFLMRDEIGEFCSGTTRDGEKTRVKFRDGEELDFTLKMAGRVHAEDAALALFVSKQLGFFKGERSLKAVEAAALPGRFSQLEYQSSNVVLDVAHTGKSIENTVETFKALYPEKQQRALIFGAVEGKDINEMLRSLLTAFDFIIISKPGYFKKSNIRSIYEKAMELRERQEIMLIENPLEALKEASSRKEAILITGSFYLAAEFKEVFDGQLQ